MTRPVPRVLLFGHELESADDRQGTGFAVLFDRQGYMPDTVHLHLTTDTVQDSHATAIPLVWQYGTPVQEHEEGGVPGDHVRLLIDDATSPVTASCSLRLDGVAVEADVVIVETGATSFAARNMPITETDALSERCVVCIGLGSGGSAVVDLLARSGVGHMVLWDHDRLEAHNISRHVCTLSDIGRQKVHAVRDRVLAINPGAQVRVVHRDVTERTDGDDDLGTIIASADCVVVGTDNNASRYAINQAAIDAGKPAIYGRAYTRACGGDIIQVLPDRDLPCYACHTEGRVVEEEISSTRDADRLAYADAPVPIEPGLMVDIQPLANMIARLVVLRLCAGTDSTLASTAEELDAPLYLWASRREDTFVNWKPMKRTYRTLSILRWYGLHVPRNPECATCGSFAA